MLTRTSPGALKPHPRAIKKLTPLIRWQTNKTNQLARPPPQTAHKPILHLVPPSPSASPTTKSPAKSTRGSCDASEDVRPYWLQATIASFAVSLKSLCDVAGPILVMVAVDRYLAPEKADSDPSNAVAHWVATNSPLAHVLPHAAVQGITRLASIYLAMLVAGYLLQFIQVYLMQWIGQKIMLDLRRDIFRHMQRMRVSSSTFTPSNASSRASPRTWTPSAKCLPTACLPSSMTPSC